MDRICGEHFEQELGRLVSAQPGSQQALLHEQQEELAPEHHGGDVGTGAAMSRQQVRSDSEGHTTTGACVVGA